MKVKLKKHKKSPAPLTAKQAKIKSTIEMLRKTHTYGIPIRVIYDRGYQQIIDLADKIQETKEKTPAPIASKQTKPEIAVDLGRRPHYWLDECTKRVIEKTKENLEKIKAEIKSEKDSESPHSEFLTNDIDSRDHRTTKNLKTPNTFMTSEQKKQITDALVSLVLSITRGSHCIDQAEATALSAALDFFIKTDSSKKQLIL